LRQHVVVSVAVQSHREQELVPQSEEVEDRHGGDTRLRHRQHHLEERPPLAGPVDGGGLGDLIGQPPEEGVQEEHGERQRERHIDDHQARLTVEQVDVLHQLEQRDDRQEDRERQAGEHHPVDQPVAGELEAGEHVGAHRSEQHHDDEGAGDDGDGVEEVVTEALFGPRRAVVRQAPVGRERER
jgi:hypothetical protein